MVDTVLSWSCWDMLSKPIYGHIGDIYTTLFPTLHEMIQADAVRKALPNQEHLGQFVSASWSVITDVSAAGIQSLLPYGNQTWMVGQWTIEIGDVH